MDNNKTYSFTPATIGNRLFGIPLYQRLFTWKEKQINQLIDDLHEHFLNADAKEYYIGMLTIAQQPDRFDLVDGQQRMTVMLLMSIAFIRLTESENWRKYFLNGTRVYFKGRSSDRTLLSNLYTNNVPEEKTGESLAKGLELILERIKYHFNDDIDAVKLFSDKIYKNLTVFVTELPENYIKNPSSLNEYFEAMNSSGKSLEQHEILKVNLLKNYGGDKTILTNIWNVVSNFEKPLIQTSEDANNYIGHKQQVSLYLDILKQCREGKCSDSILQRFGYGNNDSKDFKIGEIKVEKKTFDVITYQDREDAVLTFPEFLLIVLAIHHSDKSIAGKDTSKLLKIFEDNALQDTYKFYQQLLFCRLLLDFYVVRIQYDSSGIGFHNLIFKNWADDAKEHTNERIRQYESMLHVAHDEPYVWLFLLLKHLCSNPLQSQLQLLSFLKSLGGKENHICPTIESLTYDKAPRYWFWRLDYALWEKLILEGKDSFGYSKLDYDAVRQYEFRRNRSIEHLHPQKDDENTLWETKEKDSFGNLAMISPGFNSSQGKLPVHVKFANLEVQISNKAIQSLKLYFMYLKANGIVEGWTIENKNAHAEEMMRYLEESLNKEKE